MSLRLNGSTSGYVEIDAPAVAGNNTLRLPTTNGTDGSVLQVDSTGQLAWRDGNSLGTGFKNLLINGAMDIWQRGTSQTTTGYGSVDRWNLTVSGTCTFSQETTVIPSGAQYALKWTTGAASSYGQVRQFIEQLNVIPLRGQTVTASAYVRSGGTFTGNIIFEIAYSTSTDASSASYTVIGTSTSGTVSSSSYSQIKTTFTVPSNAVGLVVGIVPTTVQGSGAIAYQSLAQLELGTSPTPFERRAYGQELWLCQRYFEKSYPADVAPGTNTGNANAALMGVAINGYDFYTYGSMRFSTTKRAIPTITFYNPVTGQSGGYRGISDATNNAATTGAEFIGHTGIGHVYAASNNMTTNYVYAYHFTASAEL